MLNENRTAIKTAALFPGQGSQFVGMGKDLFDHFASAREVFEEASDAARLNLKKLCFDGPESDLTLTENTQPCLLTTSLAAFRVLQKEFEFKPHAVAGHSLGEYSALVAAGSISLASAVRWVRFRGQAMQQAVPPGQGTMAALMGMEDEKVIQLCQAATTVARERRKHDGPSDSSDISVPALVAPANFNAPGQIVIAGSVDGVQAALQLVKTEPAYQGSKAIPLSVSAPFHCQLMAPARDRMSELFSGLASQDRPQRPTCPIIPNRTGRLNQEAGTLIDLLIEQIDHPVLWKQSMTTLLSSDYTHAIEFGPGKVLAGLMKRISASVSKPCSMISVGDTTGVTASEKFFS